MFRQWLHDMLTGLYPGQLFDVLVPPASELGDYSVNLAMVLAKSQGKNPKDVAREICAALMAKGADRITKCEVAGPGFVNIYLRDDWLQGQLGTAAVPQVNAGKRIVIEYTDCNPFKQFHVGHLMTNVIGEALARVHEATGAEVIRVNYQGDVGLHVASSIWGMMQLKDEMPPDSAPPAERMEFLGRAYARGATAYKEEDTAKEEINKLNKVIYDRSDTVVNQLYDKGRAWSLEYFETMYARLGTKFVHYFFESEVGADGIDIVRAHPDVFVESQGAVIFPGELYGLHTRVFVTSQGLPVYEAKELALNKKKFELFHPDLSLIVTANEINDYFAVLLKAMELVLHDVAARTVHIGHGVLRLPGGKMSSRTGDVLPAEQLIADVKQHVGSKTAPEKDIPADEQERISESVALSAIRYAILKQSTAKDIVFDMDTSLSYTGNSGPYLQYTYARLSGILRKAGSYTLPADSYQLSDPSERAILRHLLDFGYTVAQCTRLYALNGLALYCAELAEHSNRFYELVRINDDENTERKSARLMLVSEVMKTLKQGLGLLGIQALERI